jgi:hypothetical protein
MTPLTDLVSEEKFEWHPVREEVLARIKKLPSERRVLRPLSYSIEESIFLFTDTSNVGAGALGGQEPIPKTTIPTLFHCKEFATRQLHYAVHEVQLLALVDAVEMFQPILYFTTFTIVTDHKPRSYLIDQTTMGKRLTRWKIFLPTYDFTIIHSTGKNNTLIDELS